MPYRFAWLLLAGLLELSCSGPPAAPPPASAAGEWREFEGNWSATGSRRTLMLDPGHQASIFSLSGSLLLTGGQQLGVGFRAEIIGLADSRTGGVGRAVWTDERGDQVFSELRGSALATGAQVTATITGGTGRYAGVTGEYEFHWQYMIAAEANLIGGRAVDLRGRVRGGSRRP